MNVNIINIIKEEIENIYSPEPIYQEGVADKYAEKLFNMSSNKEINVKDISGDMGTLISDKIESYDSASGKNINQNFRIFMNPKSLKNFEADARAIVDNKGNLFIAEQNEAFNHGQMGKAISNTEHSMGLVYNPYEYDKKILLVRVGNTDKFGFSDTYANYAKQNPKIVQEIINTFKIKNPQYEIIPEYWQRIKFGGAKI